MTHKHPIKHNIKWTPIRLLSAAAIAVIIGTCIVLSFTFGAFFGGSFNKSQTVNTQNQTSEKTTAPLYWWQKRKPDIVVGEFEYYAGTCKILEVDTTIDNPSSTTVFEVPTSVLSQCQNRLPALTYDGEYLIFSVCKMSFGAGGCGRGRYRSADTINWQEDIGITWIKGEQYEAWRNLGSNSSKADAVKKVTK